MEYQRVVMRHGYRENFSDSCAKEPSMARLRPNTRIKYDNSPNVAKIITEVREK